MGCLLSVSQFDTHFIDNAMFPKVGDTLPLKVGKGAELLWQ